jgi:uncharacterized protein YegL
MLDHSDTLPLDVTPDNPFAGAEFVDNPEPRCPCLLLLDTSGSMQGEPIRELNDGIATFRRELQSDELAVKRVEVALVTFGPVQVVSDFQTVDRFEPPALAAGGDTPLGEAVVLGLDLLRQRKDAYRANGVAFYRPWAFLITDGAPTDHWQRAADLIRQGEQSRGLSFFAIGVENANLEILRRLSVREPVKLRELRFRDCFSWLSNSLRAMSSSQPGTPVPLASPVGPAGWATVG